MKIGIYQFNGCQKCFDQTILIKDAVRISNPTQKNISNFDVAVITGYLTPQNIELLKLIEKSSKKVIAFGSCAVSGGVFGLAYQKGIDIRPIDKLICDSAKIEGCMAEIEELQACIEGKEYHNPKNLCQLCNRKSTCKYLSDVVREIDLEADAESCFNDLGYLCNGYIARGCKEQCMNANAPCRGCKPKVDRSGFRMLGMFATLMGNIEVATEATGKGGTDKLADEPDLVTQSVPDCVGSFFRFTLPDASLPIGKNKSSSSIISDVMIGRRIEEVPMILSLIGGSNFISYTLDAIEAYESDKGIQIPDEIKQERVKLLDLEKRLNNAVSKGNQNEYLEITNQIRKIAGNMNLSNLYFGGYRNKNAYKFGFKDRFMPGPYKHGLIKYTLDSEGIVTDFKVEGLK